MKYAIFIVPIFIFLSCDYSGSRAPATSDKDCRSDGTNCEFLIIGHRGVPYEEAENTLKSFQESMNRGGNALEIDVNMTKDDHVIIVLHDRHPNQLIALARQAGLEGFKYIPYAPNIGNSKRTYTEELTLKEIREDYGYALNHGLLYNIFVSNKKDTLAVIPTLKEFSKWSKNQKDLKAIFIDVKVGRNQKENALKILRRVKNYLTVQNKRIYLMSPYKRIFKALKFELDRNPVRKMYAIFDSEEDDPLNRVKKLSLDRVSTGNTFFKSWRSYLKDMDKLISYRLDPYTPPLYPIIAWTIDDDFRLYKLVQLTVDGIMTNRPRRLARLIKRHFKDHSMTAKIITKCYENMYRSKIWQHCASGLQINPFQAIDYDDIHRWACGEKEVSPRVLDVFGCTAISPVRFEDELENSKLSNIWMSPKGNIIVAKSHHDFGDNQYPVIIEFKQEYCNDGILNYDCEYFFDLEYRNANGLYEKVRVKKKVHDSSFVVFTNIPKNADRLRIEITELDGGDRMDSAVINIPAMATQFNKLKSKDGVFEGNLEISVLDYDKFKTTHKYSKSFSLDFKQTYCYDGFLNYDCEYNIKVFYYDEDWNFRRAGNYYKEFDSSFTFFTSIPKSAKWIRIFIEELDDGVPHPSKKATGVVTMQVRHGSEVKIRSIDDTFKGILKLKMFDYDEKKQHSEGVEGFKPHKVKN